MQRATDGLGGGCIQAQPGTLYGDPGPEKLRELRELGGHQILDVHSLPFVPDWQALINRMRSVKHSITAPINAQYGLAHLEMQVCCR